MTINTNMPGEMVSAIKSRPQHEWEALFDNLKLSKALQIGGRLDLTNLQAEVKQIDEMKNFFIAQRNRTTDL